MGLEYYLERDSFLEKYVTVSQCINTLVVSFVFRLIPFQCSFWYRIFTMYTRTVCSLVTGTVLFIQCVHSYRLQCSYGTGLFIQCVHSYRLQCSYWYRIVYLVCILIPFVVQLLAPDCLYSVYTHTVCNVVTGTELFIQSVYSYRLQCSYWHRIVYIVCTLMPSAVQLLVPDCLFSVYTHTVCSVVSGKRNYPFHCSRVYQLWLIGQIHELLIVPVNCRVLLVGLAACSSN